MSKATSINAIDNVDRNVSQEINNVLAEIETSKNNEMQPQQQLPQMVQQQQMMPPMQGQQLPPQQVPQYIHHQQQQQDQGYPAPNYYKNFPTEPPSGGIMDFLSSFMMVGDEFKTVGMIAALFFLMSMSQTKKMLGNYLKFTINELGDSTLIGLLTRGLVVGLIFVTINKFI